MTDTKEATPAVRSWARAILMLLLSLTFAATYAHEGESRPPPVAEHFSASARAVITTLENYAQAVTSNDLSRIKPLLVQQGDEFTYFEGTFVNVGWQSYYDHMAPEMALFEKPSYRMTDIRPFVRGNLAYATFTWAMDVTVVSDKFEGGRHPVAMNGKGTAVLSKTGGQWKIRHLHTATTPAKRDAAAPH